MEAKVEETEAQFRSGISGFKPEEMEFRFDEIQGFMCCPPGATGSSSFTALLELPPPQAVELLVKEDFPAKPMPPPIFPSNIALIDRASKFSVFASADIESNTLLSVSSALKQDLVKEEPLDSDKDSHPNSSSPALSDQSLKSKRKQKDKKIKESNTKSKKLLANGGGGSGGEKLPYVHVRARRGQATDSHSLAERARREKINARMKLLQELVPGCNKISGTATVLDEIINHVQALQRQVEFLSMRLAAVNPRIDFNLDAFLAAENGSSMDHMYPGTLTPSIWPDLQVEAIKQQQQYHHQQQQWNFDTTTLHPQQPVWGGGGEEGASNFITLENSLLSYDSSGNSASLHSNQLKMELSRE